MHANLLLGTHKTQIWIFHYHNKGALTNILKNIFLSIPQKHKVIVFERHEGE